MPSQFADRFAQDKRTDIDWDLFDERSPEYSEAVDKYSEEYNVPKSLAWAMMYRESNLTSPEKANSAGAVGPMQLTPIIAKEYGVDFNDLKANDTNIQYGIRYMGDLLKRFNNNVPQAVAAYNMGPTAVRRRGIDQNYETASYAHFVPKYQKAIKEKMQADSDMIGQYVFGRSSEGNGFPSGKDMLQTAVPSSTMVAPPLMDLNKIPKGK